MTHAAQVQLRYAVHTDFDAWAVPEEWPVPESIPHALAADHVRDVLSFWASRAGRPMFVARSLAVRWLEDRPQVGVDPDVALLDPAPPGVLKLKSLRLWQPGHVAPPLSVEVVNTNHPYKDYVDVHERYAAFGARELVVFDPELAGPKSLGGPFSLQVWRSNDIGVFERQYAGPGPVFCETLSAWLIVDEGLLHVADDRAGRQRWPTGEEYERGEKLRAQAEAERERAERLEIERRLAALEATLAAGKKH